MTDFLSIISSRLSFLHLNVLFLLGIALFGGVIGGRLFQKIRIPQVVGYIIIGIVLGESGLKIVNEDVVRSLQQLNYFALGLIGFMVGGELKKDMFVKYGKQLISILLWEGITPFILVSSLVGIIGGFILGDFRLSWALGLLLGAIASATDPATTTCVLNEYRTRGPLTNTVLGIVALDDGLALMLFAIASSIAGSLVGTINRGVMSTFIHPIYDIGGAILIGGLSGLVLCKLIRKYVERERILAFSIGALLLVSGLSIAINVDMLLAVMTLGIIVVNFTPRKSKAVFELVGGFTHPIFVLFFVLVGAKMNFSRMNLVVMGFVFIYLFGTTFGKVIGSNVGATLSGAVNSVRKYLPFCLFSQAGIAIGLSILSAQYFPGYLGNTLVIIITATTFILQLIGPPFSKFAVTKAGEIGLNITEEDLIQKSKARDVMDKKPPLIYKSMSLADILKIFGESTNLYYPVVDDEKRLLGIITVDNIKNIFMESGLNDLILAPDLMESVVTSVAPDDPVSEVKECFERFNLEYLPVINGENRIAGFIERRILNKFISTKLMELQRQVDSLG